MIFFVFCVRNKLPYLADVTCVLKFLEFLWTCQERFKRLKPTLGSSLFIFSGNHRRDLCGWLKIPKADLRPCFFCFS